MREVGPAQVIRGAIEAGASRKRALSWVEQPEARLAGIERRSVNSAIWWPELSQYRFLISPAVCLHIGKYRILCAGRINMEVVCVHTFRCVANQAFSCLLVRVKVSSISVCKFGFSTPSYTHCQLDMSGGQ